MLIRFGRFQKVAMDLSLLVPKLSVKCDDFALVEEAAGFYNDIVTSYSTDVTLKLLRAEIMQWCMHWQKCEIAQQPLPVSAIDAFSKCDEHFYPVIRKLLHILCTLPVSVATAERSFSNLRRLKTWTRSTMGEDRLTGLALMHAHRDIDISVDNEISTFATSHKTRLNFVI